MLILDVDPVCGKCRYYTFEDVTSGNVCTNSDSFYCTYYVDFDHGCEQWEGIGND